MDKKNNIIKDDVKPILTIKQRIRYTSASQNFVKGMTNYLGNYLTQVKKMVDLKDVKKAYTKRYDQAANDYVKRFQQAEQRVEKERRPVKLYLGMFITGGYLLYQILKKKIVGFQQAVSKFVKQMKDLTAISFEKSVNLIRAVDNWYLSKTGQRIDFWSPIKKITETLMAGLESILGVSGIILQGFLDLFTSDIWEIMLGNTAATAWNMALTTSWGNVLKYIYGKAKLQKIHRSMGKGFQRVDLTLRNKISVDFKNAVAEVFSAQNWGRYGNDENFYGQAINLDNGKKHRGLTSEQLAKAYIRNSDAAERAELSYLRASSNEALAEKFKTEHDRQQQEVEAILNGVLEMMENQGLYGAVVGAEAVISGLMNHYSKNDFIGSLGDEEYQLYGNWSDYRIMPSRNKMIKYRVRAKSDIQAASLRLRGTVLKPHLETIKNEYYEKYKNYSNQTVDKLNKAFAAIIGSSWGQKVLSDKFVQLTYTQVQQVMGIYGSYIFYDYLETQYALKAASFVYHQRMLVSQLDMLNDEWMENERKLRQQNQSQILRLNNQYKNSSIDFPRYMQKITDMLYEWIDDIKKGWDMDRDVYLQHSLIKMFSIYQAAAMIRNIKDNMKIAYQMKMYGVSRGNIYTFNKGVSNASFIHSTNQKGQQTLQSAYKAYDPKTNPQGLDKGYTNNNNGVAQTVDGRSIYKSTNDQVLVMRLEKIQHDVRTKKVKYREYRNSLFVELLIKIAIIKGIYKIYKDNFGENGQKLNYSNAKMEEIAEKGRELIEKMIEKLIKVVNGAVSIGGYNEKKLLQKWEQERKIDASL